MRAAECCWCCRVAGSTAGFAELGPSHCHRHWEYCCYQVVLSSDPATAIGIGSRSVVKLNPEEVSVVVRCVELETQAVEGTT